MSIFDPDELETFLATTEPHDVERVAAALREAADALDGQPATKAHAQQRDAFGRRIT